MVNDSATLRGASGMAISQGRRPRPVAGGPHQREHPPRLRPARSGASTRNGGTYQDSWDDAEGRTYNLNTSSDRDNDGHACE